MVDFRIRREAGVMAELRNIVRKKTKVEVFPVVDVSEESASFFLWAMQHRFGLVAACAKISNF